MGVESGSDEEIQPPSRVFRTAFSVPRSLLKRRLIFEPINLRYGAAYQMDRTFFPPAVSLIVKRYFGNFADGFSNRDICLEKRSMSMET